MFFSAPVTSMVFPVSLLATFGLGVTGAGPVVVAVPWLNVIVLLAAAPQPPPAHGRAVVAG